MEEKEKKKKNGIGVNLQTISYRDVLNCGLPREMTERCYSHRNQAFSLSVCVSPPSVSCRAAPGFRSVYSPHPSLTGELSRLPLPSHAVHDVLKPDVRRKPGGRTRVMKGRDSVGEAHLCLEGIRVCARTWPRNFGQLCVTVAVGPGLGPPMHRKPHVVWANPTHIHTH